MNNVGIGPGDCFLCDPTGIRSLHMWIVLAVYTPELDTTEYALIVSVTDADSKFADTTVVLTPSDPDQHEFVTKDSYVFYGDAREYETSSLRKTIPKGRVSQTIFDRVKEGLFISKKTRRGLKQRCPR